MAYFLNLTLISFQQIAQISLIFFMLERTTSAKRTAEVHAVNLRAKLIHY